MLARGCRPTEVVVDVEGAGGTQDLQRLGLRLLRPFAEVPRTAPLPTSKLTVDASLLTATTAPQLIAQALPELRALTVSSEEGPVGGEVAGALGSLLGAGQAGAAGAQPLQVPLLPRLDTVELVEPQTDYPPLPPILAAVLGKATQLRHLRLDFALETAAVAADIAGLTGLESLSVGLEGLEVAFRPLLRPLTALTSLCLEVGELTPGDALEGLSRLVELDLPGPAALDVSALSYLPHLTKLHCGALVAPVAGGPAAAAAPVAAECWQLPQGLRELKLSRQEPQELPRPLRGPPHGSIIGEVSFCLHTDAHMLPSGELLPEAEAALCAAAGALGSLMAPGACTVLVETENCLGTLLRPVGGAAAAGPGRRNHTPWLKALGAMRPSGLVIAGVALSHQDLVAISRMASLKALNLQPQSAFPASALCTLLALPALKELSIDCSGWVVRTGLAAAVCEPPEARGVLLSLCYNQAGPRPQIKLYRVRTLRGGLMAGLAALVAALQAELKALGVEDAEQSVVLI